MSDAAEVPVFGMTADELRARLPKGAAIGRVRAKVLCQHPERSWPIAEVRGNVVVAGGDHHDLLTGTLNPRVRCTGCPGRRRRLVMDKIRDAMSQLGGGRTIDADDVCVDVLEDLDWSP